MLLQPEVTVALTGVTMYRIVLKVTRLPYLFSFSLPIYLGNLPAASPEACLKAAHNTNNMIKLNKLLKASRSIKQMLQNLA